MSKTAPEKIVAKLKDNLINFDANEYHNLLFIEKAIGICSSALLELREWICQFNFTIKNDEVHFLKVAKPYLLSEYLFQTIHFEIEAKHPVSSTRARKKIIKGWFPKLSFYSMSTRNFVIITEPGQNILVVNILSGQTI